MKELISCGFNIDTGCVEAKFSDGSMIAVNCTAVENEVTDNMYERSELDWLVYNAPVDYITPPHKIMPDPKWESGIM